MYKTGSEKHQTALFRGKLSDWAGGDEILSHKDTVLQLQQSCRLLEDRIKSLPPKSPQRIELGKEKFAVQNKLKYLKDIEPKAPPDWKLHFVNEAKRILSASQFEMIINAAKREAEAEQKRNEFKALKTEADHA